MASVPVALFAGIVTAGGTPTVLYTVPGGATARVGTAFVFNDAAVSSQAVYFHVDTGGSDVKIAKTKLLSQNEFDYLDVWFVMEAGWELSAVPSAAGSWNLLVSGVLL